MANSRRRSALAVTLAVIAVLAIAAVPSRTAPAQPPAGVPPAIYAVLQDIKAADKGQLAVSEEDGRFLRLMVASSRATRALEIGGASGYSAIWIGLGLRETGGKLVTIEYDPQRARELKANIARAGLEDVVQAVAGDAFKEVPKVAGPLDFVFVDAWKPDYKRYFDMVFPRLAPGGLLLAHNVRNKATEMQPFLSAIEGRPDLLTTIVSPSSEGMSVSWKRH
jgi:predicted O-methyltransferase YrrM